ncbi:MAG: hypothetical protein HKN45_10775 [Flavobacteriales bacterium]|nr:hypothetical protein [Flavobacteriales bacterium]
MSTTKVPTWFKVVAVLALLWNLMGLVAFFFDLQMTPEQMAELHPAMQEAYQNSPSWNWIAYGIAVVCGVLGSIMLLLRKRSATLLFGLSLLGILIQNFYTFLMVQLYQQMGGGAYVMPILVVVIGIYLYLLSRRAMRSNWIT